MLKTEYTPNGGFLQRDSVEHKEYAEVCSTESQEIKEKDVRLCKNSLYIASKYDIIALDKLCESWDAK